MAASRKVAEQHEDWLNLTAPEQPWFAVPAVKRAFPNGLDRTPPEIRAEHKVRWNGDVDAGVAPARTAADRTEYIEWLLRDVLDWRDDYLAGDQVPDEFATGVTRHAVTVTPTGVYHPRDSLPVGLFDNETDSDEGRDKDEARVLVFVLPAGTEPASRTSDAWSATWVQRAALACRHTGVPLALVTDGDHLTLVHAEAATSTGWGTWRASEFATEPILLDSIVSMLHARRFIGVADSDTPTALLAESVGTQAEVTNRLGDQVRKAVELLVNGISRANLDRDSELLDAIAPHEVYAAAATGMMRLVFLLVAEENGLLPVDSSHYQSLYAVRTLREDLQEESFTNPEGLETRSTAWHRLLATGRAVHAGVNHHTLVVSAYGSALFDPDRFPFLEGRGPHEGWRTTAGTPIPVTDLDVLAILDALLVLRFRSAGGVTDTRRLSYRQVDVEQIGHIYERLLDHDALVAHTVVLGLQGRAGDEPEVPLPDLEAKALDGEKALLDFLSDDKAKNSGVYVAARKRVQTLLTEPVDPQRRAGLLLACGNDPNLVRRIEPFANLLRLDLRERPVVFLPGSVYVTETGSRRDSGTAYTTRELAAEVAEHALAPLCYSPGPQDTSDENAWRIRPSNEILDLKVCDPAVGSGAILVAACRYLADRLVEAWRTEGEPRAAQLATAADDPNRLDVVVAARRLIAEHCCYGVDRNPMAVEIAKLSMWLTTVAIDRPFTFLDHAIKAGDSLLGIWSLDQLRWLHFDPDEGRRRAEQERYALPGIDPVDAWNRLDPLIDRALELRAGMHALATTSTADVERKVDLHRRSEQALTALTAVADLLTAAALSTAAHANPTKALTDSLVVDAGYVAAVVDATGSADEAEIVAKARARARLRLDAGKPDDAPDRNPFHWPLAFPEVFMGRRPGFDAMVGNPPFVGGQKITGAVGTDYRSYLVTWLAGGAKGSADLVVYFFLHATHIARALGYLATNTVGQGDSSEVGLAQLINRGWIISRAVSSTMWPGEATLEIAKVWLTQTSWAGDFVLDNRVVKGIDEMLYPSSRSGWRKQRLAANRNQAFQGSNVLGLGFTMPPSAAEALIVKEARNDEVLSPYLGGEDLNESPTHEAPRWVINFFDWSEERARSYPDCYAIVWERVRPERAKNKDRRRRELWWQFTRPAMDLYRTIDSLAEVMVICQTSKLQLPALVPTGQVFNHKLVVFSYDDYFHFGVLSSGHHWRWVLRYGSSMRVDPVYTPSDVFETFPQPRYNKSVELVAAALNAHRSALMIDKGEGLTKTYNRVHNSSDHTVAIKRLRDRHIELDYAVRDAYGWSDLDLGHGFHEVRGQGERFTFSPEAADEVLDRLLELNKARYEAETAAGLHKGTGAAGRRARVRQPSLLEGEDE